VSFYTEDPKYTAEGTDQYGSNVIFRSVFENKSNEPQTHSLKTERQTVKCPLLPTLMFFDWLFLLYSSLRIPVNIQPRLLLYFEEQL
jgi:hypothetical protein